LHDEATSNPKFEYRNPKQIRNPKFKTIALGVGLRLAPLNTAAAEDWSSPGPQRFEFSHFPHFEFVSNFDIRISDFSSEADRVKISNIFG